MAYVAGLFDSEADATAAMDHLMRMDLHDLETRVMGPRERKTSSDTDAVVPIVPNTGGAYAQPSGMAPAGRDEFLDALDEVERAFYYEGLKEGASLAVAKVDDADAEQVRQVMRIHMARTYTKD